MKNIAIFGSSRSGKTSLAKMISKKYSNYHIIIGDDIRWAFQEVLPGNQINTEHGEGMKEDFPNFLASYFYKSIKRNYGEFNYIVETCDMTPSKAKELFDRENTILLFIGTPNQTIEQHIKQIREYETEKDWTYTRSDEYLLEHSEYWIEKSKEYKNECEKLNIWYVDTSENRDEVLNKILKEIESMIFER